ncbi:hypothetical protein BN2127_JRS4_03457 [Bacillus cereus]|nr:hypothetical protein BN2127_JRS4_03457 [Bacillus cereus]
MVSPVPKVTKPVYCIDCPRISFRILLFPLPFLPSSTIRSSCSTMKLIGSFTTWSSYLTDTSAKITNSFDLNFNASNFNDSVFSTFFSNFDFSSITFCCLDSRFFALFIILAALCPTNPLSNLEPEFLVPFFEASTS